LEQLPEIVKEGRKRAEQILEGLEGKQRVRLQAREWVLPARDSATADWIAANAKVALDEIFSKTGPRRICVRAVDVFGFEAEAVQTVAEPAS
jgi:hypothetical protein